MPYFDAKEFRCPCPDKTCIGKTAEMHPLLLERLETLRELLDAPVRVNSGYRCPSHNAEIDGEPGSYHMKGEAADITCDPSYFAQLKRIANGLFAQGGIGTAEHWCHVDVGPKRRWTYPLVRLGSRIHGS